MGESEMMKHDREDPIETRAEHLPEEAAPSREPEQEKRFEDIAGDFEQLKDNRTRNNFDNFGMVNLMHEDLVQGENEAPRKPTRDSGLTTLREKYTPEFIEEFVIHKIASGSADELSGNWQALGDLNNDRIAGAIAMIDDHDLVADFLYAAMVDLPVEGEGFKKLATLHPEAVLEHMDSFAVEEQQKLAEGFLAAGHKVLLAQYLGNFSDEVRTLLAPSALQYLIENGDPEILADSIDVFDTITEEAVNMVIDGGYSRSLFDRAADLKGVDWSKAIRRVLDRPEEKRIEHVQTEALPGANADPLQIRNKFKEEFLDRLRGLDDRGDLPPGIRGISANLDSMNGVDSELFFELMERDPIFSIQRMMWRISSFAIPNYVEFMKKAVDRVPSKYDLIKTFHARCWDELNAEDKKTLGELFLAQPEALPVIVGNFSDFALPPEVVLQRANEIGEELMLLPYLEKFPGLDAEKIVTDALRSGDVDKVLAGLHFTPRGTLPSAVAELLISKGHVIPVFNNLQIFKDFDSGEYLDRLISEGKGKKVVDLIKRSHFTDVPERFYVELINMGGNERLLMKNFYKFKDADSTLVIEAARKKNISIHPYLEHLRDIPESEGLRMIITGHARAVAENLGNFAVADWEPLCGALIDAGHGRLVLSNLRYFSKLDPLPRSLAERFIARLPLQKTDYVEELLNAKNLFKDFPDNLLAKKIIERKNESELHELTEHIDTMHGLDNDVALYLFTHLHGVTVLENLSSFQGLDRRLAQLAIDNACGFLVLLGNKSFVELERELYERAFADLELHEKRKVNKLFDPPLDKTMAWCEDNLNSAGEAVLQVVSALKNGDVLSPEMITELEFLGVNKFDERGLTQLLDGLRVKRQAWIANPEEIPLGEISSHKLLFEYFKDFVRFDESADWALTEKNESTFREVLYAHKSAREKGEILPLSESYKPSDTLRVKLVNREAIETHKFTKEGTERYRTIIQSMGKAKDALGEKKVLSTYAEKIEERRLVVLDELKKRLETLDNEKGIQFLKARIDALEHVTVRSVRDLEKNLNVLLDFKEFGELIRQTVFYMAFMRERAARHMPLQTMHDISFDNIVAVIDFVDHITDREVMHRYFKNDHVLKKFENLLGTRALSEEMARAQNVETKTTTPLRFIPTRGILHELSGYICDSCWVAEQGKTAQEMPNMTSIVMSQYPGNPKLERLVGATMLIETESAKGEPLLVIRGLNPIESYINRLSVPDFMRTIVTYLEGIATASGRKLAIVDDDARGKAGTNRQVVFDYMNRLREKLTKVELKSANDTTFNSYDIVNDCYFISSGDLAPSDRDKVSSEQSPA